MDKSFRCPTYGYYTVLSLCPRCSNFICKDINDDNKLKYISKLKLEGDISATTIKKMEELRQRFK